MSNDANHQRPANGDAAGDSIHYEPPGWLSTDELEHELFLAVVGDSKISQAETRFQRIDSYFAADEPETELEYRRSLLRLLAGLRPQVAELLGGPRKCE